MKLRFIPEKRIDLTKKISVPDLSPPKRWKPSEGKTFTMTYGKGTPTPSPTVLGMAHKDVAEYYPYLLKDSEEYNRRLNEFLIK